MAEPPDLSVFPDRAALMAAAADLAAQALRDGVRQRGQGCAALSGGATPEPAYSRLAQVPLPWPQIRFLLVDERCVPLSHPDSNERMLRSALAPALGAGATLTPLHPPSAATEQIYAALAPDVAVMGMGLDGHTASWFPGAKGLHEAMDPAGQRAIVAIHAPSAPQSPHRLTITLPVLLRARRVMLLLTGAAKLQRLKDALDQDPQQAPVAALFRGETHPTVLWAA